MHAGPKSAPITEEEAQKKNEEKLEALSLLKTLVDHKKGKILTVDVLDLTTKLLTIAPENYDAYNYRRLVLLQQFSDSPTEAPKLLEAELKLNSEILKKDYKCYSAFTHRHWVYEQLLSNAKKTNERDVCQLIKKLVTMEMKQCEALLRMDERNFHVWNYRRWAMALNQRVDSFFSAAASAPLLDSFLTVEEERDIEYTTQKIEVNFSNYSAWHQRSLVFQTAFRRHSSNNGLVLLSLDTVYHYLAKDTELLCKAIYCDPNDQSPWFYAPFVLNNFLSLLGGASALPSITGASSWNDFDSIKELLQRFDGDLIHVFVSSVIDLIVENKAAGENCALSHNFLLLLFVDLLQKTNDQRGEHSMRGAGSGLMATSIMKRIHLYSKWVSSEVVETSDLNGAESGDKQVFTEAVDQLARYLADSDPTRNGMHRQLVFLAKSAYNALC